MRVERELMRSAGPVTVLRMLEVGEMYGYELASALGKGTDGVLAMGHSTLYPLLYNLEAKKLIASRWRRAESNRQRRYYALTDRGRKRLAAERGQWQALVGALTRIGVLPDTVTASLCVEPAR